MASTDASSNWATRKVVPMHNHHMDSTAWERFEWRDDDIIVATWGKTGTTLTQQLLGQLLSGGDPHFNTQASSPWLDHRLMPPQAIEAMKELKHRRVIKTHLPSTAMPYNPNAKFIVVVRDGRDCVWSMHNHHSKMRTEFIDAMNNMPGLVGPPLLSADPDLRRYFHTWLRNDGAPFWPFFSNVRSWWELRHMPNVMFVHFNNLRRDLLGEGQRIAAFIGAEVAPERWPAIVEHCSMDWMRANADKTVPLGGAVWEGGAASFIHKGTNGRWRDVLTEEDVTEYERQAEEELGRECAEWLATGQPADATIVGPCTATA